MSVQGMLMVVMKKVSRLGIVLFVGCFAISVASADQGQGRALEFGAKVALNGATFGGPDTDAHQWKLKYSAGGFARIGFGGRFAVQPELLYVAKGSQVGADNPADFAIWSLNYVEVPILGRVELPRLGAWLNPYVVVGPTVGVLLGAKIDDEEGTLDLDGVTNRVEMGLALGVGTSVDIMPAWALTVEARYDWGLTDVYDGSTERMNRVVSVSVGVGWRRDHDTDGDGVGNGADRCWREAEDRDGFEDSDGCPELDNDKDGVADAKDSCVNEAEDLDGFEDADGCPDTDNDKDGVLDDTDECDDTPFKYTANGCPPVYAYITVTEDKIELKQPLLFAKDKAELQEQTKLVLDEIATALGEHYPEVRVRIEGHADGEGSTRANEVLSQKRADAVRDYLIGKGIAEGRLVGKGYGEEQPLYQENTPEAERKNRRVEFVIISK